MLELPHEGQVFLDCGPSVLNWKVTLHYSLESIWTQPAYAHWQLPACMPQCELGPNLGSKLLEGVNFGPKSP